MTHAPHLPPKTCHVHFQKQWQRVVIVSGLALVAFISGIAAALVASAWLIPSRVTPASLVTIQQRGGVGQQEMDHVVAQQVRQRTVRVYTTEGNLRGALRSTDLVGDAVLVTRDGWAVLFQEKYTRGAERQWTVFDHTGAAYTIEKVVQDPLYPILYLQITGGTFRGDIQFAHSPLAQETALWHVQGTELRTATVGAWEELIAADTVAPIWQPRAVQTLQDSPAVGAPLVLHDGTFAGFAGQQARLIPSQHIRAALDLVFLDQPLHLSGLPWYGYPVERVEIDGQWYDQDGFYITRAVRVGTTTPPRAGDVVLTIGETPYSLRQPSASLFRTSASLQTTVLRNGKEMSLPAQTTIVKP